MKPILIHSRIIPFGNYRAITLFPCIIYKGEALSQRELQHETIHLWQQIALLVVPFYLLYLLFWIANLIRYCNQHQAYHAIPFERSAYALEGYNTPPAYKMAFDWLRRIRH